MKMISFFLIVLITQCSSAVKFRRQLLAAGFSHFKILMALGSCKGNLIYSENKIWTSIRINRVFDIYYKSQNDEIKVSRVEIYIVVNHSDVMASSEKGLGRSVFSASVYLPADSFVVFYSLHIFTCSEPNDQSNTITIEDDALHFFDGSIN